MSSYFRTTYRQDRRMALVSRRFASSKAISAQTKGLAQKVLAEFRDKTISFSQLIDANQLQRLSVTLGRPNLYSNLSIDGKAPLIGTPLPPGYHLVYFTPDALPQQLGRDGTDLIFSPDRPFTRRMWAGGELRWMKENPLRVGDVAVENTRLLSAEPKTTRSGEEMILVSVEKTFENADGVALIDKRDWVFRTELLDKSSAYAPDLGEGVAAYRLPEPSNSGIKTRDFCQSPVDLFRFSALTFNGHMIHYAQPWCREVEGHRDIVVHGPLNLINMLDFWRDSRVGGNSEIPRSIRYRATAPFYGGEKYRALLEKGEDQATHIKLWGHDGEGDVRVGMIGDIVAY